MKGQELSLATIMGFFAQVMADASITVVTDPKTNRKYSVKSVTEYVSFFYSQLDNGNLLIAANQPKVGVRSIGGIQLPEGKIQVVHQGRILSDTSQALETEVALVGLPFANVAPPCLKNGEFRMNQTAELLRTSGTDISNSKASTGNDDDFRTIVPVVLRGGVDMNFTIKTPGGLVIAAGTAGKFEYRAVEFLPVAKS